MMGQSIKENKKTDFLEIGDSLMERLWDEAERRAPFSFAPGQPERSAEYRVGSGW